MNIKKMVKPSQCNFLLWSTEALVVWPIPSQRWWWTSFLLFLFLLFLCIWKYQSIKKSADPNLKAWTFYMILNLAVIRVFALLLLCHILKKIAFPVTLYTWLLFCRNLSLMVFDDLEFLLIILLKLYTYKDCCYSWHERI